jgi:hypothetical protein
VAISCVLAARRAHGIVPILSERMKEMTLLEEGYPHDDGQVFDEIGVCYEIVCGLQRGGRKQVEPVNAVLSGKRQQYLTTTIKANVKSQVSTCDRTPRGTRKVSNDVDSKASLSSGNFEILSEVHAAKPDEEGEIAIVKAIVETEEPNKEI